MAINGNVLTAHSTKLDAIIAPEMLSTRPNLSVAFSPARPAGQLCGFYNAGTSRVELYVVSASGIRFLRVG